MTDGRLLTHPAAARERFRELMVAGEGEAWLSEAALVIALEEYPGIDVATYCGVLGEWGAVVRERTEGSHDLDRFVGEINRLLFDEEGFHAENGYWDPRNTYLNEVLDRHGGLGIALSIVYIEVCRSAGFASTGVALPGLTLVRLSGPWGEVLIDPQDEGRVLTRGECEEILHRLYGGGVSLREHHLRSFSDREILGRLLAHIKAIRLAEGDFEAAVAAIDRILILDERDPWELRERGLLRVRLHDYEAAVEDLEQYLRSAPYAEDARKIRDEIEVLRSWLRLQ